MTVQGKNFCSPLGRLTIHFSGRLTTAAELCYAAVCRIVIGTDNGHYQYHKKRMTFDMGGRRRRQG